MPRLSGEFLASYRGAFRWLDLELKVRRAAKAAAQDRGTTVRALGLEWVDHDADRGAHGVINDRTRRE